MGWLGGHAWQAGAWPGVVAFLAALWLGCVAIAVRMARLPAAERHGATPIEVSSRF